MLRKREEERTERPAARTEPPRHNGLHGPTFGLTEASEHDNHPKSATRGSKRDIAMNMVPQMEVSCKELAAHVAEKKISTQDLVHLLSYGRVYQEEQNRHLVLRPQVIVQTVYSSAPEPKRSGHMD